MLKSLLIRNFALIDNVELTFEKGLTVITGETGSGKSILLGALNLLLGSRADFSVIRDENEKTIVEGHWSLNGYDLANYFAVNGLDYEDDCIIRREILPKGKSRAFINDTPVSLAVLKELTDSLIQINSQHQTIQLRDKTFQLELLDVLGECSVDSLFYQECFAKYKEQEKHVKLVEEQLKEAVKQQDYIQFQLDELDRLELGKNDYEALLGELKIAENAELLLKNYQLVNELFDNNEGVLSSIKKIQQIIRKTVEFDAINNEWLSRIDSQLIELNDLSSEISNHAESISINPTRIDWLIEHIDDYQRILKKHSKENQTDLAAYQTELSSQLSSFLNLEEEVKQAKQKCAVLLENVLEAGAKLTKKRQNAGPQIVKELLPLLNELKLPDVQIEFKLITKNQFDKTGFESVDICFSPNKGTSLQSIEKSASGGELGRFMLVVMTLLSQKKQLSTLIFDEIDTGVSGDVAGRIGLLLRKMGDKRQLMAITHLPQVAASGHAHLCVKKSIIENRTVTEVVTLSTAERKIEIAKLMSGKEVTEAAIENASNLLVSHGN
jgi:DNA repair protein RecN (Recombination protein N)